MHNTKFIIKFALKKMLALYLSTNLKCLFLNVRVCYGGIIKKKCLHSTDTITMRVSIHEITKHKGDAKAK